MKSGAVPSSIKNKVYYLVSLISLFALWKFTSLFPSTEISSPESVFLFWLEEAENGQLFLHVGATLYRVVISFSVAFVIGAVVGLVMGFYKTANSLLDFWLIFLLNIPALVVIILSYILLGLTETAAVIAVVINKIPNQAVMFREAARAFDHQYLRMARVYRIPRGKILLGVVFPQIFPFLLAASRSGLSLIWKIVLVVELLGRSNGVGFQLHYFFQLFYIEGILAYSVTFILIIQLLEWLVLIPIEKKANRWRKT